MDHPQITHVSLCAGYGGIDLGLHRCIPNLRTIAYSEIEAFACELLLARMEGGQIDAAPIWPDLKSFPWSDLRDRVDLLSGGYPCQPFSSAGKQLGKDDPRHLWPYIADGIRILQPALCFFENVEGHITLGLRDVLHDLGGLGYRTTWGIFSASEVGAPHQRKRVFILAHRADLGGQVRYIAGSQGAGQTGDAVPRREEVADAASWRSEGLPDRNPESAYAFSRSPWPSRPGEPQFGWEPPRVVGNADSGRLEGAGAKQWRASDAFWDYRTAGRQTEPALGRDADGPAGGLDYAELCIANDSRVDELRLLGNGVVPAVAERAFRVLLTQLYDDLCPTTT